jgi:DNA polymerase-3 subunit alpha
MRMQEAAGVSGEQEGFVHLRVRSAYSLLEGAIKADKIGVLAAEAGMPAVALTDRANLFGALEFSVATKDAGVQPIIGCALPVTGIGEGPPDRWAKTPTVVLLAQNEQGYANLSELSSAAFLEVDPADEPNVSWAKVCEHSEGLILLSGGPDGPADPLFAGGRGRRRAGSGLRNARRPWPRRRWARRPDRLPGRPRGAGRDAPGVRRPLLRRTAAP